MKILIVDLVHPGMIPMLEGDGYEVAYSPSISPAEILKEIPFVEGLVIRSKTPLDRELLEHAPRLQFIARAGAGLDQIDLDYVASRKIKLFHAAKGNRDAVAEHALGGLLALFNQVIQADRQVRSGVWDREGNRGHELKGKTVGILGYGNMGKAFGKRLQGFGVRVLAYDKYKEKVSGKGIEAVSWETLKATADVLSIHVPLTEETRGMLDLEEFQSFAKPIWVINTARGEIIPFDALNRALEQGVVRGAVLDVLENEKFQSFTDMQKTEFQLLAQRSDVIFSPHVAGWTVESYEKINQVLVKKIKKHFPISIRSHAIKG